MEPELYVDKRGNKEWILHGVRHRLDGPAVECGDYYRAWYFYGERHREDGPAVEWDDGRISWWLDGKFYTFDEWCKWANISSEEKTLLVLKYG